MDHNSIASTMARHRGRGRRKLNVVKKAGKSIFKAYKKCHKTRCVSSKRKHCLAAASMIGDKHKRGRVTRGCNTAADIAYMVGLGYPKYRRHSRRIKGAGTGRRMAGYYA